MCLTGGIGGVLLAGLGRLAFTVFADGFPMVFSAAAVSGALLCSTAIGVLFGFLPARNAARMKPIDALARGKAMTHRLSAALRRRAGAAWMLATLAAALGGCGGLVNPPYQEPALAVPGAGGRRRRAPRAGPPRTVARGRRGAARSRRPPKATAGGGASAMPARTG